MLNGIGPTGRADTPSAKEVGKSAPAARPGLVTRDQGAMPAPAAEMAAEGAPVDSAKVAELRKKIADGSYRSDPHAIADAMILLDLPGLPR